VLDQRLVIVTGKGGVGRSAVASAIARTRASRGERVLALAIDRGRGLAAHLGVPALGHEPTEVVPNLRGSVVDPSSALEEYVRLQVRAPIALAGRVFRLLALTVPGVRDIVLIGKVWHEAVRGDWDAVVVDAAPAGQIQSILQAPATIADLVPRGSVHDQARRMGATLADPEITSLVIVATPEELPLTEAEEVMAAADDAGITSRRFLVLNRVVQPAGFTEPPPTEGPVRDAAILQLAVETAQARHIEEARADHLLPLLFGSQRPADVSSTLAAHLEQP
jgi:anion-transporting  ArsA/GET3 family ATPase